jgi:hypothetical protein
MYCCISADPAATSVAAAAAAHWKSNSQHVALPVVPFICVAQLVKTLLVSALWP